MKHLPTIAGVLLGAIFLMASITMLLNLVEMPSPPEGSPAALFMGAFGPTGYMTFIKVLEIIGGIIVMIPRFRNLGLLILGPIIVNILAFHVFITVGHGLLEPMIIGMVILSAYLLWVERRAWLALIKK
jgi:hypothetical protein